MKKKKEPKEKITYIEDENFTVVDMSGTVRGGRGGRRAEGANGRRKSTFKEKAATYFRTMKHMIMPMLLTILGFALIYGIVYLLL